MCERCQSLVGCALHLCPVASAVILDQVRQNRPVRPIVQGQRAEGRPPRIVLRRPVESVPAGA